MTDTTERKRASASEPSRPVSRRRTGVSWRQAAVAVACGVLGFTMVAQVRSTEGVGERLAAEREENLARILSELTAQSDRMQAEITELRLTLLEFETSAEAEELAVRSLQRRIDDLQVLIGSVAAEGEGIVLAIDDEARSLTQDLLVDAIQELRDAGAEAIAVNERRLVGSSAFSTSDGQILLDGRRLTPPYRIYAIGPADTMAAAMAIPGGAVDSLQRSPGVTATVETRSEISVAAADALPGFVYAVPLEPAAEGSE
jgi:uncharacterized protein YlxW (UPF0749 family)